jgi:hypothetical protein
MPPAAATVAALELQIHQLRRHCNPNTFSFETTTELEPPSGLIGQQRAADALAFGLGIPNRGFNTFVSGAPGTGKASTVRAFLEQAARQRPTPDDWCYVHNFRDASRPRALRLRPGQGRKLREQVRALVQAARRDIPRAFESEEYIAQREGIGSRLGNRREQGFSKLAARARQAGFFLQPTPIGLALIAVVGNQQLSEDDVAQLNPEMRATIERRRARSSRRTTAMWPFTR